MRNVPPSAISQADATNGSRGSASLFERNEPDRPRDRRRDHHGEPERRRSGAEARRDDEQQSEEAGERAEARRARRVLAATSRSTMIWSGTVPAIIAATLESIRVSATCTMPDAEPEQEPADDRARTELGTRDAQRRAAPGEDRCEEERGGEEARPGGEERRDRVDRDLDPEVRRAPDDVDDERARSRRA